MLCILPQVNSFHNRLNIPWYCGKISESAVNLSGNVARAGPRAGARCRHYHSQNKHQSQEFPPQARWSQAQSLHSDGVGVVAFNPLTQVGVPSIHVDLLRIKKIHLCYLQATHFNKPVIDLPISQSLANVSIKSQRLNIFVLLITCTVSLISVTHIVQQKLLTSRD